MSLKMIIKSPTAISRHSPAPAPSPHLLLSFCDYGHLRIYIFGNNPVFSFILQL